MNALPPIGPPPLVLRADARCLPLADSSVDLVVTSPPYFGLRSYTDGGKHYDEQIGAEATPAEFVDALIDVTRECMRVLKPSGSIWVNLGDKYAGSRMDGSSDNGTGASRLVGTPSIRQRSAAQGQGQVARTNVPTKSLIGVPWRYALRCIDDLGLILRAEVIWSKPNGLPESVTDRVRRSHEQWFHFTKEPRYFSAVDEVREEHAARTHEQHAIDKRAGLGLSVSGHRGVGVEGRRERSSTPEPNPLGKLPGSVWTVPTEPLRVPEHLGVDHFAAFPSEFPRRIISGWSSRGVCVECGEGRRPVAMADRDGVDYSLAELRAAERVYATGGAVTGGIKRSTLGHAVSRAITGYACACPEPTSPTTPVVVLDPFGGTGTTAHVAHALGRQGISVDLSADYCRIARDPDVRGQRVAKVRGFKREKRVEIEGQADLFGGAA